MAHACPIGQAEQSAADERSVAFEKVPFWQGSAAEAPLGQYEPASHASQADALRAGWYVPPSHCAHSLLRALAAKLPCAQPTGCAAPPVHE